MTQFQSPYFAAVDLGSNSFHMLIVRFENNRIKVIDREKEMVQIARGLKKSGKLSADAQERALDCLHRFSDRLHDIPDAQIRAVGTKTLRSASNSQEFLKAANKALGAPIQIISGFEEARLVYNGLAHSVVNEHDKRLVIDIGGGSTEFIIGKSLQTHCLESLSLGCVTYTESFELDPDNLSSKAMHKAYLLACSKLEQIRKAYIEEGWQVVYGTSGTMKAIGSLLESEDGGAVISRKALDSYVAGCLSDKRLPELSVSKLRRATLPAGLTILQAIFDQLQIDKIHVADATLKEGLIYDNIGRFSNQDSRVITVTLLQEKYRIDRQQASVVSMTALHLWKQMDSEGAPMLKGVSRTKILDWAAKLHEIGLSISHSGHQSHGYYILRHSDLAGFSRYEQHILANLVRNHRKKPLESRFEGMDETALQAFLPLLFCLRIATLLHRRRELSHILPTLTVDKKHYHLALDEAWLDKHPLTKASLDQECNHLRKIGIEMSFT